MTLTPAFVILVILVIGRMVKGWAIFPMVVAMMFAFSLSAASPVRPAIDSLNNALISLMNSIGGGGGIV